MDTFFTIVFVVAIAAAIGGFTNYLAIKMLFYPRNPIYIKGKKLPFTPGLIPKRKDEIAGSLGRIVASYLVTSEGVAQVLQKTALKDKVSQTMRTWTEARLDSEETVGDLVKRLIGESKWEAWQEKEPELLKQWAERGIEWIWVEKDARAVKMMELIPGWDEETKQYWVNRTAEYLLGALKQEMLSENGTRMLKHLIDSFLEKAGGWMGTLAGIFMDEEKLLVRVRRAAVEQLEQPYIRKTVTDFLHKKASEFEQMSLQELLEVVSEEDALSWLKHKATSFLTKEKWSERLYNKRLGDLVGERRNALLERLPKLADWLLEKAAKYVHKAVEAIDLPKLVEEQVTNFPVERVEQIVLTISGREFRAITWLGALLGGVIGLFQSIFFLFLS